jgi:hypothetical protein
MLIPRAVSWRNDMVFVLKELLNIIMFSVRRTIFHDIDRAYVFSWRFDSDFNVISIRLPVNSASGNKRILSDPRWMELVLKVLEILACMIILGAETA